ncbi:MAG: hypothetical protein OJJ54_05605 [Pseudonocardia sp.]|nr:hypothetical protein [Pseudonocardia sp.]
MTCTEIDVAAPARPAPGRHRRSGAPLERARRVVVAAVDGRELLAEAGGLLQRLHGRRIPLEIVFAAGGDLVPWEFARCGLADVPRSRLGLRRSALASCDDIVLAALSEVVGFDPGAGVGLLAPGPLVARADRDAVASAAARAARAYKGDLVCTMPGIPSTGAFRGYLLTPGESRRKAYALGPGASSVEMFAC